MHIETDRAPLDMITLAISEIFGAEKTLRNVEKR